MATIFYSMAGEGRGHATRVRCMVEYLRHQHRLVLFAPGQAFEVLAPRYAQDPQVEVVAIPGLRFHYSNNKLHLTKSVWSGLGYLRQLPGIRSQIEERIKSDRPDLAISDFEPSLPRAARRRRLPLVSLDHQHFLLASDLSMLPGKLGFYAKIMKPVIKAHCRGQRMTIVSSFFRAPLRRGCSDVVWVGPLLRPEVRQAIASQGDYLLSYVRPQTPPAVLEALRGCGRQVRVYGLGERPPEGPFTFRPFDEVGFVSDLAGCAGLVGAAGNQTLGEALSLRKPVLAMPEPNHYEQLINAFFLRRMGAGEAVPVDQFRPEHLQSFLSRLGQYEAQLATSAPSDGGPQALAAIEQQLLIH